MDDQKNHSHLRPSNEQRLREVHCKFCDHTYSLNFDCRRCTFCNVPIDQEDETLMAKTTDRDNDFYKSE